nr:tRNA dihydrouridine(20/20a) synthase DusA [Tissierella sp.]
MKRISIAPMVDVTDKHFRYFCRLLTKKTVLYTEMISAASIIKGDRSKILDFDPIEKPLVLQLAGATAEELKEAVAIAEDWDYDEINLNIGCPSDRVSGNDMGAALMAYPEKVSQMVKAMKEATDKPISVKHRIGIDGRGFLPDEFSRVVLDEYEDMKHFVELMQEAGVTDLIVHARIAILAGLSPKENRQVPPIRYDEVYRLKKDFPNLFIEINGGIRDVDSICEHLKHVDGVMIGRASYEDSFILSEIDRLLGDERSESTSRREVIEGLIEYVEGFEDGDRRGFQALKNVLGLFHNKRGSKVWRRLLTPPWPKGYSTKMVLEEALREIEDDILDER